MFFSFFRSRGPLAKYFELGLNSNMPRSRDHVRVSLVTRPALAWPLFSIIGISYGTPSAVVSLRFKKKILQNFRSTGLGEHLR